MPTDQIFERRLSDDALAFLASAVVDAYSVQHRSVVEKLEANLTHHQNWKMTAAYTGTDGDRDGRGHRRAYFWYAAHFPKYMGRRLRNAPSWFFFDRASVRRAVKPQNDEIPLHLRIPRDELLIMQYSAGPRLSWERVLGGIPCCEHAELCSCASIPLTRARLRAGWEHLFELSGKPKDWQAIADRIEPDWYVGRMSD